MHTVILLFLVNKICLDLHLLLHFNLINKYIQYLLFFLGLSKLLTYPKL